MLFCIRRQVGRTGSVYPRGAQDTISKMAANSICKFYLQAPEIRSKLKIDLPFYKTVKLKRERTMPFLNSGARVLTPSRRGAFSLPVKKAARPHAGGDWFRASLEGFLLIALFLMLAGLRFTCALVSDLFTDPGAL
jgi:hypothetical protein